MVQFLVALVIGKGVDSIKPPMHRAWTVMAYDVEVKCVRDGQLVYTSSPTVASIDVRTGKAKWSVNLTDGISSSAVDKSRLYLLSEGETSRTLSAIELTTGTRRTLVTLPKGVEDIACDNDRLYTLEGTTVQALDSGTGKEIWRKKLAEKPPIRILLDSITAKNGHLFVGIEGVGFHSIDGATGTVHWKENAEYGIYDPPYITERGVLTAYKKLRLLDFVTGKPIWSSSLDSFDAASQAGNILIGRDSGQLMGLDLDTGQPAWRGSKPDESFTRLEEFKHVTTHDPTGSVMTEKNSRRFDDPKTLFRISKTGHQEWSVTSEMDGEPEYWNDELMVCSDGDRLLGYVSGDCATIPNDEEGKRAMAKQLIADFESLDLHERNQIVKLAQFTTGPLIELYTNWALEKAKSGFDGINGRASFLYSMLTREGLILLDKMCGKGDTDALQAAIDKIGPKNEYRDGLTKILGDHGDASRSAPRFVAKLKESRATGNAPKDEGQMLEAVAKSDDPVAVKFMIEALNDPKAPRGWREAAFLHLAGTGGEAGVAAVRRARTKSGPMPTWQQTMLKNLDRRSVVTHGKDAKGRSWRLVKSGILGHSGDLFLQPKQGEKWGAPIFLDIYLGETFMRNKEPKKVRGVSTVKLIESEWLKFYPDDASIRKDSDGDGLTDLVERRLGINPNNADTDGDGLKDSIDPCPDAAPRTLGDTEKIVAACVEAHFFESDGWYRTPAVIAVEGVKPFQMSGYPGILLWDVAGTHSLHAVYGGGTNQIGIMAPRDFDDKGPEKPMIVYSTDRMTAETMISRYSGGLNGEGVYVKLKKVGDEWFVVDMQTRFVS